MEIRYRLDYEKLSDRQVVDRILADPHDEEAAVYMLYYRYKPLLLKLYSNLTTGDDWYDDCVDELFMLLKGKDNSWNTLASFQWNSTFGYWLGRVASNKFIAVLRKVIGKGGSNISIDSNPTGVFTLQSPDDEEDIIELRFRKILLLEAIGMLKNDTQRFVALKRLQEYSSREIAVLLKMQWQKHGTVVLNNNNEPVEPDEDYVNLQFQRAKRELKKIIKL